MNAAWIQAVAVGVVVFVVLGLVFWSLCRAAHDSDERMDAEAAELTYEQSPQPSQASTTAKNLLICAIASLAVGLAGLNLQGPSAAQAEQDVQDEVAALTSEPAAVPPIRPQHPSVFLPTRTLHASVVATAR